jgi:hypothetical protein
MNNKWKIAFFHNLKIRKKGPERFDRHDVVRIPGTHSYFNSVTIISGCQGSGKDAALFSEVIPQSHMKQTHLIIYVRKKDYDPTVEESKPLLGCQMLECNYDECEDIVKNIISLKQKYYQLLRIAASDNVEPNTIPDHVEDPSAAYQLLEVASRKS